MSYTKMLSLACAAALLGAVGLSGSPSLAQEMSTMHETVSFPDLDLRTRSGVETLLVRLDTAAHHVCVRDNDADLRDAPIDQRRCRADAMAAAIRRVRNPAVTSAFMSGRPQEADYRLAQQSDASKR